MAVPGVGHDPVDRERQDGVPGDPADLEKRLGLARPEMLEHLQRDEQVVGLVRERPRCLGRIVDDLAAFCPQALVPDDVHHVGTDDQ